MYSEKVTLMTVHSAKGLEFRRVLFRSEEEFSLSGITITFNSGTTISVKRTTPGGVIKMLRDYERKEGDPCIL